MGGKQELLLLGRGLGGRSLAGSALGGGGRGGCALGSSGRGSTLGASGRSGNRSSGNCGDLFFDGLDYNRLAVSHFGQIIDALALIPLLVFLEFVQTFSAVEDIAADDGMTKS